MKYFAIFTPKYFYHYMYLGSACVLAQKVLEDDVYMRQAKYLSHHGANILLDNGTAEREMVTLDELIDVACAVGATEIILPDKKGDPETTIVWAERSLERLREIDTMIVLHGNSEDEWEVTLRWVVENRYRGSIGLPKYIDSEGPETRIHLLDFIGDTSVRSSNHVHLLGLHGNPIGACAEFRQRFPWVRSIDTAAPLACAQKDLRIEAVVHAPSLDWDAEAPHSVVMHNVSKFLEVCDAYNIQTTEGQRTGNTLHRS